MTKRSVFFAFLLSVYCSPVSVAQLYTDEVQVINGLGGKVGVGATSPEVKLDLGSTHGNGLQFRYDQNTTWRIRLTPYWNSNTDTRLDFNVSVGPVFNTIMSVGYDNKVGIGTTTPARKLEIAGDLRINDGSAQHKGLIDFGLSDVILENNPNGTHVGEFLIKNWTGSGYSNSFFISGNSYIGIGLTSPSQKLSVNGNASKATAGDWLANSDARLKTNISPLHSQETLQKMLQLQGITYEWSDDKTGLTRPTGIQYGFTAQNIQEVFPSLVVEDNLGYLQSSYSTYDAMLVESIRALNEKIERLERENRELRVENASLKNTDKEMLASIRALQEQMLSLLASQAVSAKNENHQSKSEIK